MGKPNRKTALIQLLEKSRADELAFWNNLSETERSAKGEFDHWSPKDNMAHVIAWKDDLAYQLEEAARDKAPKRPDYEEENRKIFEVNYDRTWEELLTDEETIFTRLNIAVEALTDEQLDDPNRYEWTIERPLWWRIGFTGYYHPMDHLCTLYRERGEEEKARAIHERIAVDMKEVDEADTWQGTVTYNLACFYALNSELELAMNNLREAFKANPSLMEWSEQDSDLDSLRELPDFQALYT
ncbi:MAG: ClbS/DfsB family four-helix bundle protein [Anaerolineales bacterium]|nr:ClbS/DfsB family four-helix bundle protein [Anaerolineales bacterium]